MMVISWLFVSQFEIHRDWISKSSHVSVLAELFLLHDTLSFPVLIFDAKCNKLVQMSLCCLIFKFGDLKYLVWFGPSGHRTSNTWLSSVSELDRFTSRLRTFWARSSNSIFLNHLLCIQFQFPMSFAIFDTLARKKWRGGHIACLLSGYRHTGT